MFTNNKFGKFDAVADAIKNIAEADYKAKMEELKGQQHKIDKNKNNKVDADDFKILRGEKKGMKKEEAEQIDEISSTLANKYLTAPQGKGANKYKVGDTGTTKKNIYPDVETMSKHSKSVSRAIQRSGSSSIFKKPSYYKEEAEQIDEEIKSAGINESNNPFDLKNYKSQLPTKPGEKAGFDSKKISTGTVYSRKPVKDEPMKKEEIDPNDTTTDTLKGREKTSGNPFLSKKVKMDVPDNVKEEAEQIDELKKTTVKSYLAKKMASLPGKDPKKDQKDMMKAHHRVTGVKPTSEEVEQIDELSKDTLKSYSAKAKASAKSHRDAGNQYDSDPDERAFAPNQYKKAASRTAGAAKADSRIKEEAEQIDEGSMDKATLTTLWKKHANHTFTKDNYKDAYTSGTDSAHHAHNAATAIENHVRKKYGNKVADDMVNHSEHSSAATDTHPNSKEREYHDSSAEKLRQKHKVGHVSLTEEVEERTLTPGEKSEKERIVKGMKKSLSGFKARYGKDAKSVMYATATARAKK